MNTAYLTDKIFNIRTDIEFNDLSLKIFHYQYSYNPLYHSFVNLQVKDLSSIDHYHKIPFLPIEFFKTHKVYCYNNQPEKIFQSSGTTGQNTSKHYVADLNVYKRSSINGFEFFYGDTQNYIILALLPSYMEREGSSLIYMVDILQKQSTNEDGGFYLNNSEELIHKLTTANDKKIILLGVSFALLELVETHNLKIDDVIVMETGGMKGKRKEMIREELHDLLCNELGTEKIHSEYGMTELLSQAYSFGDGDFRTPPWMKILIRDINDPKSLITNNQTGGINVIDLANIHSCSFIATQDLGRIKDSGHFEVLGRFDLSDIRGCNLLIN